MSFKLNTIMNYFINPIHLSVVSFHLSELKSVMAEGTKDLQYFSVLQ